MHMSQERVDDHLAEPAGGGRIPLYGLGELTADDSPMAPFHDMKVDAEHGRLIAHGEARWGEGNAWPSRFSTRCSRCMLCDVGAIDPSGGRRRTCSWTPNWTR